MTNRDVLVVDDEEVITQGVTRICTAEAMSVDSASSGAAALELLESRSYRIIVCDIMMTDVDGFEFLAETARRGITTPVVMATGYSTVENAVRSLCCGAVDFIPKPFTADELLAVVRRGIRCGQLRQMAATRADAPPETLAYVPCPSKYYRLGYVTWVVVEHEGTALVGVTDLFLKTIDGLKELALSKIDDEVVQGESCASLLSLDGATHAVICPLSGRIVEVNPAPTADPTVIEKDPYFEGWLYRIVPSELESDLKQLAPCSSDRL
jgi:FixJ family two-component response regulator/glycine cleavage system H lipoate-binding protein